MATSAEVAPYGPSYKKNVMFLCNHNSCRSQMAEGWMRALRNDASVGVASSGIVGGTKIKEGAIVVMKEAGVDITGQTSDAVADYSAEDFDVVVSCCGCGSKLDPEDKRAWKARPVFEDWNLDDPPAIDPGDLSAYRRVQYADGGFKRFRYSEFAEVVVREAHLEKDEPQEEEVLGQAARAACAADFALRRRELRAGDAAEVRRLRSRLGVERASLDEAIKERQFLRAHEVDQRIRALEAVAGEPSAGAREIVAEAASRAVGGGLSGAAAMGVQVLALMWLRTTLYYQYRYGASTAEAMRSLYAQGGIRRFYSGVSAALLQGPLSRFGDTAANTGALALLNSYDATANLAAPTKSFVSATVASAWRVCLMPLDTAKTMLQVEGSLASLRLKLSTAGPGVLYHGSLGLATSAFAGHWIWFTVYNSADASLPVPLDLVPLLARNAAVGFCASAVTDVATNPIRILKTVRQTSETPISYRDAAADILRSHGLLRGLFGRGLGTRLLANGLQAALFSVVWKFLQKKIVVDDKGLHTNHIGGKVK
ncbi:hypothetical protein CTAYLR_002669 [Chrysophaeum taylorii]|uniref:Phosphotyrosine protein phosphatase I domain-containing protein n=1 Tax=Chrysophaeum taylorii TaxID=2483200 RepID=A0AAD7XKU6_9STRA|nr:hypothetical protein CTAYLR_002669 [Chrysophaeum taylorii]